MSILQVNKAGKTLYAIVTEQRAYKRELGGWFWEARPIVYLHALDVANARFEYARSNPKPNTRIVAIAPAIGFHVEDNHGDKLHT